MIHKAMQCARILAMLLSIASPRFVAAQTDLLDVPLKKQIVKLGPSPYYPSGNVPIKLTCDFYRTFMVKEYDEGQKGAEWLAIVPVKDHVAPPCNESHAADEKVIVYPEWHGYFRGAKGNLVMFHAADGEDGGMPFVVYDAKTQKQLFRDSYYEGSMWRKKTPDSPFNEMRVNVAADGPVFLKYLRVAEAGCDLHLEKTACWQKVRKKFDLKLTPMPVCSGYKRITTRYESAVAYPVEVSLFPQPSTKTIDGPAKCWPVD